MLDEVSHNKTKVDNKVEKLNPRELREKSLDKANNFFKENLPDIELFRGEPGNNPRGFENDVTYTRKLENLNNETEDITKQWSIIQEAIILNEMEMSDWFGEESRTIRPTNHADFVQKVDGIVEINGEKVAFDATYKKDPYDKVHYNHKNIDSGNLSAITYFYDDKTEFKGSINIPGIVLGFDKETLEKLTPLWFSAQEKVEGSHKKLAEHPVQMLLIYQALMQFSAYEMYSKGAEEVQGDVLEQFTKLKNSFLEIYNQKIADNRELNLFELDNFTETLISEIIREYHLSEKDIRDNIWPPKEPKRIIKIPRPPQDQLKKAA